MWRRSIHRCLSSQSKPITHIQDFKFTINRTKLSDEQLTAPKIYENLDRRVIGQHNAKRALAIAFSIHSSHREQMETQTAHLRNPLLHPPQEPALDWTDRLR